MKQNLIIFTSVWCNSISATATMLLCTNGSGWCEHYLFVHGIWRTVNWSMNYPHSVPSYAISSATFLIMIKKIIFQSQLQSCAMLMVANSWVATYVVAHNMHGKQSIRIKSTREQTHPRPPPTRQSYEIIHELKSCVKPSTELTLID